MSKKNKIFDICSKVLLAFALVITGLFSSFISLMPTATSAATFATSRTNFENTNVLDDLLSADENFVQNYPPNEKAEPAIQVINFVEYCYSYKEDNRNNYGLYVYIYNPTGLKINTISKNNQIQIGVKYDTENVTSESVVTDYEKFDLLFCNASTGDFENLYLKFKVIDKEGQDGKTIAQRVNPALRRYDISSVEIFTEGSSNAVDYPVANTYVFTGYAAGYGFNSSAESTLSCESKRMDYISLDVNHTYYRTLTSAKGADYQNQIDSVYFSVPNRYFTQYGTLQRIKAEWYEFKTSDIIVTSNESFYNALLPYLGMDMSKNNSDYCLLGDHTYSGTLGDGTSLYSHKWNWDYSYRNEYTEDFIYYLLGTKDWCDIKNYDPNVYAEEIGGVSSNDLLKYIYNYDKSYNKGTLNLKDNNISLDMFEDDIDDYRKMNTEQGLIQFGGLGKSYYDFDADVDVLNWQSWNDTEPSFIENWANFGFWNALFGVIPEEEGIENLAPIHILTANDFIGSKEEISKKIFVNTSDIDALYQRYLTSTAKGEKVVLFRFALSDYMSEEIAVGKWKQNLIYPLQSGYSFTNGVAYRAQESVFLDFDIIQLTFAQNDIYIVIPAVSDPIDIAASITPPYKPKSDWGWLIKLIIGIIIAIVVIALIAAFAPNLLIGLFNIIVAILTKVFEILKKLLTAPFKSIKNRRGK